MNALRKIFGIAWLAIAAFVAYFGLTVLGLPKLSSGNQSDLVFGIIIVFILLPIVVGGLTVFGWYALKGEYTLVDDDSHHAHYR